MRGRVGARLGVLAVAAILMPAAIEPASAHSPPAAASSPAPTATAGSEGLDAVARYVASLPPDAGVLRLAAMATEVGHWQFVNRAGEPFTAAGAQELEQALRVLAPQSQAAPKRIEIHLAPPSVFRYPAALRALPDAAQLYVLIGGQAMLVRRTGTGEAQAISIEVAPGIAVDAASRPAFDEIVWQLKRPVARAKLRTLALEPGGPTGIPRAPTVDPDTRAARADAIDPGFAARALTGIPGQSVLITGRVEAGRLAYKGATGGEGSIAVAELLAAARAADVNLIVLAAASPRQPGSRNLLWLRVGLPNMAKAAGGTSLAETLQTLAGEPERLVVSAGALSDRGILLRLLPQRASGPAGAIGDAVSGAWSGIVTEATGSLSVESMSASLLTASRQAEIDRRLIAGVPSLVQYGALVLIGAGLLTLGTLSRWWRRLWPRETPQDYGSRTGHLLARLTRGLAFLVIFLPLAGLPAIGARGIGMLRRLGTRQRAAPEPVNPIG